MSADPVQVLCADPPWRFGDKLPGDSRGAEKNYKVLSVRELCRFPLPLLAETAWLFLWRVASMQQEALDVARMWGFTVKSEVVWEKLTKNGKPHFGMGRYVRASHETALVCVRGKAKPLSKSIRSRFSAPLPVDERGRVIHSAKPEFFYREIVEKLAAGPYVEIFARHQRAGWTCLGDQSDLLPDPEGGLVK